MTLSIEEKPLSPIQQRLQQARQRQAAAKISRRPYSPTTPLSFAQERQWLVEQLTPGDPANNRPTALRLIGNLDQDLLQQSLEYLVQRHASLRTTFSAPGETLEAFVSEETAVPLITHNLQTLPECEREDAARQQLTAVARRPFDLENDAPLRANLWQITPTKHLLLLNVHHINFDGWSEAIMRDELTACYQALAQGHQPNLPPLPIAYSDYAHWQRQQAANNAWDADLAYWRQQLSGDIPPVHLPTDFGGTATSASPIMLGSSVQAVSPTGAEQIIQLPLDLVEQLQIAGQQQEATLFMTLLAAYKLLLQAISAEDDITVGVPVAGRNRVETEGLIGLFVNVIVLRSKIETDLTFAEFLQQVRQTTLAGLSHQSLPFAQLIEAMQPKRDMERPPFYQTVFQLRNYRASQGSSADDSLKIESYPFAMNASAVDLSLDAVLQPDSLQIRARYRADRFSAERIAIFLDQFRFLLTQIGENPELPVRQYSLLTPETASLLPDPTQPLSNQWEGSIQARVSEQTAVSPHQLALIDENESWSYAELEARSNQLAHHLRAQAIGEEDVVAIYAHRSASLVWAILGIFKAGAAYTILDPAYPTDRLLSYLQVAQPKGFIQLAAAGDLPETVSTFLTDVPCRVILPNLTTAVSQNFLANYPNTHPTTQVGPDSLALVTFTSGSTGQPKGVMGRHGPLSHFLPWQTDKFNLTAADRFSMLSGLSHDPLQRDIFTALWVGGTLCIPSQDSIDLPGALATWMAEQAITFTHMTPPMAQLLTETAVHHMPSLRYAFFVGDKLTQEDVSRLRQIAPNVTVINSYGSTETQRAVTYQLIPPHEKRPWHKAVYPLGTGMDGTQILLLNKNQQLAGIGEAGEIYMRSHHLARGYLGDKAKTNARFLPNPFTNNPGDRLYRTGDLGRYLPDGRVVFAGRADRQVKIRGFRIEPGEVEVALRAYTAVRDAVVTTSQLPQKGTTLIAHIAAPATISTTELRTFLQARLPDFMVPAAFVFLEKIPLTPNGKINYKALPDPNWQNEAGAQDFVPPRNEIEAQLVDIWQQQLGVNPIGVTADFFALGGHSLLAIRMFAQIEKLMGNQLPISLLFQHPTIAQLAKILEEHKQESNKATTLVPIKPTGSRPPFFCVHGGAGHIFHYQKLAAFLHEEQPFYGIQPPDWTKHRVQVPDLTTLAASYVKALRKFQPKGPYFLGGFCFGGTIVFEMASQLQAAGEEVALLALIEPSATAQSRATRSTLSPPSTDPATLFEKIKRFGYGTYFHIRRGIAKSTVRLKRAALAIYLMTGVPVPTRLRDFYLIQFVTRPSRIAYKPTRRFEGNLHLAVVDRGEFVEPTLGWYQYTAGSVTLCQVNTNHVGVLREPHVQIVAKDLQRWLDEAQLSLVQSA